MFKNVAVTFRKQTEPMMMSIKDIDAVSIEPLGMPKTEYVMEIKSDEFFADIRVAVHYHFLGMTNAIASCLMAGLKLIDGHEMVYHEIASQLRTNLGIEIFHGVSSDIAYISKAEIHYNNISFYEIIIADGIGFHIAHCKDFVSYYLEEQGVIKLEFKISDRDGKVNVISKCFDKFAFHSDHAGVIRHAQTEVLYHLHKSNPKYGADWELLRTEWFGNPQPGKTQGYVPGGFISGPNSFNHAAYPEAYSKSLVNQTAEPPVDVGKLPGVREDVKHPISGRQEMLWNVIVDLNDKRGWSRERIADWLETLDVDISFGSESESD